MAAIDKSYRFEKLAGCTRCSRSTRDHGCTRGLLPPLEAGCTISPTSSAFMFSLACCWMS